MGKKVFANKNEIACKAGDGKVVAAFPDVCMSPPGPPAGPIPVPYPNSSSSKDLKDGSKSVLIGGKEAALRDKSYYKTSPLGDEAATKSFGANVVNHGIGGKTYFVSWSMDVQFEGKNVVRHIDLTTSNHGSQPPGNAIPVPNLDEMDMEGKTLGEMEEQEDTCACCGLKGQERAERHGAGVPITFSEFYGLDETDSNGRLSKKARKRRKFLEKVMAKEGCTCATETSVLPKPPCNVFRKSVPGPSRPINSNITRHQKNEARDQLGIPPRNVWEEMARSRREPWDDQKLQKAAQINHLVPLSAGGCPTSTGNLQAHCQLCKTCQSYDAEFTRWQGDSNAEPDSLRQHVTYNFFI
ncbi:DUF4150 domain-containing protein [Archangium violaceum]|uniref:DUF4150 domain-containing protein n=1 Tax=Archangium violaceum TaxID=83451 RepID=UPI002B2B758E|nr:DUF4150 domain-containing protein [Archangium gephyra]